MRNKVFSIPSFTFFLALFLLLSFSIKHVDEQKEVKYFTLTKGNNPMSNEVKTRLIDAYKAQYGKKSVIESVTFEDFNGATWLVFTSGSKSNPTVAYQTYKKKKPVGTSLPSDAPKETCTGDPCQVCKFAAGGGCYCLWDGACNHTISRITDDSNFMAALFN